MVVLEEPDTIIPYVRICGGTGGAIRPPTRLLTAPPRSHFGVIARHNRFGACVGAFLPHRARERRHNAGVSAPSEAWCALRGESPRRVRASHPPVSSVASLAESDFFFRRTRETTRTQSIVQAVGDTVVPES